MSARIVPILPHSTNAAKDTFMFAICLHHTILAIRPDYKLNCRHNDNNDNNIHKGSTLLAPNILICMPDKSSLFFTQYTAHQAFISIHSLSGLSFHMDNHSHKCPCRHIYMGLHCPHKSSYAPQKENHKEYLIRVAQMCCEPNSTME